MNIVMYASGACPYCALARRLLQNKGVDFEEIRVDIDASRMLDMQELSGRTTVPQIFIDGRHIGGCDELHALEQFGKLDVLLDAAKQ